ncbi:MAG: MGMT family protein [Caldilineaceae bacterium]
MPGNVDHTPTYARVYAVVRQIPPGKVATYGANYPASWATARRMSGYAMSAPSSGSDVPWQRVVNARADRPRGVDLSTLYQRELLEERGIVFSKVEAVSLRQVRWDGPDDWLVEHGFDPSRPGPNVANSSEIRNSCMDMTPELVLSTLTAIALGISLKRRWASHLRPSP